MQMAAVNETEEYELDGEEVIETGDFEETKTILGDRVKIREAGVVRAGLKLLKASCSDADKAKFRKLEADGLPYDEIDKQLGGTPKSKNSKLYPSNCDHFVIRECDFKRPEDARFILNNFADADGKVRRLPIWFPVGDIATAIPHNFKAFDGSSNVLAYSFYDGETLKLKYLPKKANPALSQKDWPVVDFDPKNPPADAPAGIKFGGMYKFYIEGIKGVGEIVVPTKSWYGLADAVAAMRRVTELRGRFNGTLDGKPFLELRKVQQVVKTPEGERQKQWIVTVECTVDAIELERAGETRLDRGRSALQLIKGGASSSTSAKAAVPGQSAMAGSAPPVTTTADKKEEAPSASHAAGTTGAGQSDAEHNNGVDQEPLVEELISPSQVEEIDRKISEYGVNYGKFLEHIGVRELWMIEQKNYGTVIAALELKRQANERNQKANDAGQSASKPAGAGEQPSLLGDTGTTSNGLKNMNAVIAELVANKITYQADETAGALHVKLNATDTANREIVKKLGFRWDNPGKTWIFKKAA